MQAFEEQLDYGIASRRKVFTTGVLPELREGQLSWKRIQFDEREVPKSIIRAVHDHGYATIVR